MEKKRLPVGFDDFEEIRKENYYYVDKTCLIRDLLSTKGKVNLFTRPRRFGKTLNMSMLKNFFEIGSDKTLFDGLAISRESQLMEEYQGKYPVVFLSLKCVEGNSYEDALYWMEYLIASECKRLIFLEKSADVNGDDREIFCRLLGMKRQGNDLQAALVTLMRMLHAHYGEKVILLIDEYDVPLDKANSYGYYEQMVSFLRGFFGEAFKTNPDLYFAVVTGCLRISKESIFTGINNLKVDTIMDKRYEEYFGFTDGEVRNMLRDYDLSFAYEDMKAWYDGYRFGDADVYCPWDVVNHCDKLLADPAARPKPYWNNTSSNQLVQDFIGLANGTTQREIEQLVAGESIQKKIVETLTYGELTENIDNLWSVLFLTGYLTAARGMQSVQDSQAAAGNAQPEQGRCAADDSRLQEQGRYAADDNRSQEQSSFGTDSGTQQQIQEDLTSLVIPNREVREIFIEKIQKWFQKKFVQDEKPMQAFCQAFLNGDAEVIQKRLNVILSKMISVLDTRAKDDQKENFYHGLPLGLLRSEPDWLILSNTESGDGFSDILIEPEDPDAGLVIEVKYASSISALERVCREAMAQIKARRYDEKLRNEGREDIGAYGIAFSRKRCKVMFEKLNPKEE